MELAQVWKVPAGLDGRAVLYLAVIVLVGTVGAFTLFLQGIALVGPVKAALFACLEPLTAATLSVVWLHGQFYGGGSGWVCVYSGDGCVDEIGYVESMYSCPEALRWGMEMCFPAGRSFT